MELSAPELQLILVAIEEYRAGTLATLKRHVGGGYHKLEDQEMGMLLLGRKLRTELGSRRLGELGGDQRA